MYENLGSHLTLTIVAVITTVMAPVSYILYKYGHQIKIMGKYVQNKS